MKTAQLGFTRSCSRKSFTNVNEQNLSLLKAYLHFADDVEVANVKSLFHVLGTPGKMALKFIVLQLTPSPLVDGYFRSRQ